jgi:long-subunit acyl-CoA synthetase (AMP-forming)
MSASSVAAPGATANDGLALDAATFCEAFQRTIRRHADGAALRRAGDDTAISWREYGERVEGLAGALAALGIGRGDTVALLLTNRPETHVIDMACVHLGAVPFNLYATSSPEQLEYLIGHAESKLAITEAGFSGQLSQVIDRIDDLEHVFVLDERAAGMRPFEELVATPPPEDFDFEAAWQAVGADDLITLIYTSGTTGPPKGVELTHENLLGTLRGYHAIHPYTVRGRLMSYLPMAHLADRMSAHYPAIVSGASVTSVADPRDAGAALLEVRPTNWIGVPRVWEKMKAALEARFAAEDDERRTMIEAALEAGIRRARLEMSGDPVPAELQAACDRADAQLFAPLRAALGLNEARTVFSGAAPISGDVLEFFGALGLPIFEIWGQTETSAAGTANRRGAMRVGTVGHALPGTEVRLAEDGELLFRGPGAMRGYRKDPEKTAEALDADGWIHTGDVGEVDADGFIRIVDRKKELIINSTGKNMSPANIENALKSACPLIGSAVAIGDRRPYITALLVLDPDAAGAFAREHGIQGDAVDDLAADDQVLAAVEEGVKRANERLSRVEQIKRFKLLGAEWAPGGDELTPTMKLKRKVICEKYADAIDELYG